MYEHIKDLLLDYEQASLLLDILNDSIEDIE